MLPKTIWLLWWQGFETAPELVKCVRDSWVFHNPEWEVVCLDASNLNNYPDVQGPWGRINIQTIQAFSDYLRLNLLKDYGGVWADATTACLRPLNDWVHEAIEPAKVWMYHGRDRGRGPASWFMISEPGSTIATLWAKEAKEFLSNNINYEYAWMDRLFAKLALGNQEFLESWKKVPYMWCEDPESAHCLANKGYEYDPEFVSKIAEKRPFAVKLSWRGHFHPNTNAWLLLENSKKALTAVPPLNWGVLPPLEGANFFGA